MWKREQSCAAIQGRFCAIDECPRIPSVLPDVHLHPRFVAERVGIARAGISVSNKRTNGKQFFRLDPESTHSEVASSSHSHLAGANVAASRSLRSLRMSFALKMLARISVAEFSAASSSRYRSHASSASHGAPSSINEISASDCVFSATMIPEKSKMSVPAVAVTTTGVSGLTTAGVLIAEADAAPAMPAGYGKNDSGLLRRVDTTRRVKYSGVGRISFHWFPHQLGIMFTSVLVALECAGGRSSFPTQMRSSFCERFMREGSCDMQTLLLAPALYACVPHSSSEKMSWLRPVNTYSTGARPCLGSAET